METSYRAKLFLIAWKIALYKPITFKVDSLKEARAYRTSLYRIRAKQEAIDFPIFVKLLTVSVIITPTTVTLRRRR